MAKKDDEATADAEKVTAPKEQKAEAAAKQPATEEAVASQTPWPLITIGVVVTLVVLAIGALWWLKLASLHVTSTHASPTYGQTERPQFGGGNSRGDGPGRGRGGVSRVQASGVVTAVNGDTLTVAGSGKQVTVKKTDSTVISGDASSIAVNDTVLVYGTTADDGTVTATRIVVRNTGLSDNSSSSDSRPGI